MSKNRSRNPSETLVVAHRGASGRAPENTEDSFRLAAMLGADAAETDVRRTRDGALVLIHDDLVDRTSDGTGCVQEFDLDHLRRLDMGSWFGSAFEGERILTLEEGLSLFKSLKLRPVLELKEPETCADIVTEVRRQGLAEECHAVSFLPEAIASIKTDGPQITATLILDPRLEMFRRSDPASAVAAAAQQCGAEGVGLYHSIANKELVQVLQQRQLAISILLVNRLNEIRKAVELGVEAVLTDFPDRARRVLGEPGR